MKGKTILISDPDRNIVRDLLRMFKHEEVTFIYASTANDCIEWLDIYSPDVLLINTQIQGMGILELVSVIKLVKPKSPIIITANEAPIDLNIEKKLREEGIFYLFIKSFGLEELKNVIHDAVKGPRSG